MPADRSLAQILGVPAWGLLADERSYRVVRFALAATVATFMGYASGFAMPFLVPVLASGFFAKPTPRPSLKVALGLIVMISAVSLAGVMMARLMLAYGDIFLLLAFLVLFWIFYAKASGVSPVLVVFLLLGVTVIPIMALDAMALAIAVGLALTAGSIMVMGSVLLSFSLMPDVPDWPSVARTTPEAEPVPSRVMRARTALVSTGVVLPVFATFYFLGWTDAVLVLVFIAMLSLSPSFQAGKTAGKALIAGNLLGGIGSIVFYHLLIVYPSFTFFLPLTFLTALVYGGVIYSDRPTAPLFATGFNTVLLMVGMSVAFEGTEATAKFYTRIVQIMIAVLYVVAAFGLVEAVARRRSEA